MHGNTVKHGARDPHFETFQRLQGNQTKHTFPWLRSLNIYRLNIWVRIISISMKCVGEIDEYYMILK